MCINPYVDWKLCGGSVGVVTRLRSGRTGVPISVWTREFPVLQNVQMGPVAKPALLFSWRPGAFPGGKAAGCELPTHHLLPTLTL